jgi:anti-anti-sigma factor
MGNDVKPSQAGLPRVEATYEGAEAIITIEGELDHRTAEQLVACIFEALSIKPSSVSVDAYGVAFTDSSGLSALLRARALAFVDRAAFSHQGPVAPASTGR